MKKLTAEQKQDLIDEANGEIPCGELNRVIQIEKRRENGSLEISWDYSNCPTMTEQHTGHLSDLNYLIAKYKPDELAQYVAARSQYRQEILNHDFSAEPNRQQAMNALYQMKKNFDSLPEEVRITFKNHVEFLKFIDNPANAEKMVKLGLLTKKEIEKVTKIETNNLNEQTKNGDQTSSKTTETK